MNTKNFSLSALFIALILFSGVSLASADTSTGEVTRSNTATQEHRAEKTELRQEIRQCLSESEMGKEFKKAKKEAKKNLRTKTKEAKKEYRAALKAAQKDRAARKEARNTYKESRKALRTEKREIYKIKTLDGWRSKGFLKDTLAQCTQAE